MEVTTDFDKDAAHYGAAWDSRTGSTEMTRLGAAEGKTAGSDFDYFAPWSGMKLCNVADDGEIKAYIGDQDFKRDGSKGQVMVQIPKFYYKHIYDNGVHEFWVADEPAKGFKLHPAFIRAGVEKDYICMGAYEASFGRNQADTVDALASVSKAIPAVSKNITQFRELAETRGSKWTQTDALTRNAVALLYLVEYADTNCQSTIGSGFTGLRINDDDIITGIIKVDEDTSVVDNDKIIVDYTNTGQYYKVGQIIDVGTNKEVRNIWKNRKIVKIETDEETGETTITVTGGECPGTVAEGYVLYHVGQETGSCDSLAGASGSADGSKDNTVSVSYRGLENLWGNVWEFVDGINIKNRADDDIERIEAQPYIADHGFDSDSFSEPYIQTGITLPLGSGYIKDFTCSDDEDWLLMPLAVGGSKNTYIPDYFYENWSGNTADKVVLIGGSWNTDSTAGLFYWHVHDSFHRSSLNVGTRLLMIP